MDSSSVAITPGSSGLSEVLTTIAQEINEDLIALKKLFRDEFVPRAKRIGDALSRAKGNFGSNADFYEWAEERVGIKQRQVRTYLRFANKLPAIEAAAEETNTPISSMEQGLALLAPPKEEAEMSEKEALVQKCAQATGRARGALERAMDAIYDLAPNSLTPSEVEAFQNIGDVLARWGTAEDPTKVLAVDCQATRVTSSQPTSVPTEEWTEETPAEPITTVGNDELPLKAPLGEWTLHQLERGVEKYGSQPKLAEAMDTNPKTGKPYTRAAISTRLSKLREAAGIGDEADSPTLSVENTASAAITDALAA